MGIETMKTSEAIQAVIDGMGLVRAQYNKDASERIEMLQNEVVMTKLQTLGNIRMRCASYGLSIRDDWYLIRDKPGSVSATKTIDYSETDSVSKVVADSQNVGDEVSSAVQSVLVRWHGPVRLTYKVEAIDGDNK